MEPNFVHVYGGLFLFSADIGLVYIFLAGIYFFSYTIFGGDSAKFGWKIKIKFVKKLFSMQ